MGSPPAAGAMEAAAAALQGATPTPGTPMEATDMAMLADTTAAATEGMELIVMQAKALIDTVEPGADTILITVAGAP